MPHQVQKRPLPPSDFLALLRTQAGRDELIERSETDYTLRDQVKAALHLADSPVVELAGPPAGMSLSWVDADGVRQSKILASDADRAEALARARAGEVLELEAEVIGYIQRATPNRNHWRIKKQSLKRVAKTFANMPFLRDHSQWTVEDRGGTITASKYEAVGDDIHFVMTVRAVKQWAVEGFLDGTIDRFSIGVIPLGDIECSLHKATITECYCWPGEADGKGGAVEWILEDAEGIELSAVNVPAVVGTTVKDIRSLAASLGMRASQEPRPPKENIMDRAKLCTLLGLAATATDDEIEVAIRTRETDAAMAAARAQRAEGELAGVATRVASLEQGNLANEVNATIAQLYSELRLRHSHAADGTPTVDPVETALRGVFASLGIEAFRGKVVEVKAALAPIAAATRAAQNVATAAMPRIVSAQERGVQVASAVRANPYLEGYMASLGLSEEQVAKYGPKNLSAIRRAHPEADDLIRQGGTAA